MSISNNSTSELVITCKIGPNEYKKNYIYLNDYTLYVVKDITGTHTDPYHYKLYFHTQILRARSRQLHNRIQAQSIAAFKREDGTSRLPFFVFIKNK